MGAYIPPGWPAGVHPPGSEEFESTAVGWLLDVVPPDYRLHGVLRRYPVALATMARYHSKACVEGARQGYRTARTELAGVLPPHAVDTVLAAYRKEGARLAATARAVDLVERALRGEVFTPKMGPPPKDAGPIGAEPKAKRKTAERKTAEQGAGRGKAARARAAEQAAGRGETAATKAEPRRAGRSGTLRARRNSPTAGGTTWPGRETMTPGQPGGLLDAGSMRMVSQVPRQARILLVDDRVENLIALDAILSSLNQILVSVRSGEQALEALRRRSSRSSCWTS